MEVNGQRCALTLLEHGVHIHISTLRLKKALEFKDEGLDPGSPLRSLLVPDVCRIKQTDRRGTTSLFAIW